MNGLRASRWRVLLLAGLVLGIGTAIALLPGHRGWFDVGVYHGAVNHWVRGHGQLYDYVRPGTEYGFTYPPFAAVCMLPMALLGWYPTIAVNLAVTVAATAFVLYVLIDPIARREGWSRWFSFALAGCLFAMLGPVRDTVSFGQINLVLMALVYLDLWLLERRHWLAGVGSGVAAAIKLTPAIFIGYLLVTRQWRAAAVASGTAAAATALTAVLAPGASRTYFTDALWDTGRVGVLDYVSNQSLLGMVARLNPAHPDRLLWVALVGVVAAVWVRRARRVAWLGDHRAGFALTGVAACLISPITWVHHLVWLAPALVVLADAAPPLDSGDPQARRRLWASIGAYVLLASSLVWLWSGDDRGVVPYVGGNSYVLLALGMLLFLPVGDGRPAHQDDTVDEPVTSRGEIKSGESL
ncbi:DUF2029 domain-containing protein [Micromonospora sp. NBC_00898]|uniref:glycosyltransferase family 87 protein n=1 Tax=Micromonospora sp. NBC_00898 TaxID=2975981 RepID=UPI003867BBE1|nr:DUF2029 domain-containing protein [Micromonospora sp. NBC_00898]